MEKVKPTIIKPEGMTFEELIIAYEKKCAMWNELKELVQGWLEFCAEKYMLSDAKILDDLLEEMKKLEKENDE